MLLQYEFRKNGNLTDATSVVLSNEEGTAGIIRQSDSEIIVAPVEMAHVGLGLYEYTFDSDAGEVYNWYAEVHIDGNIIRDQFEATAPSTFPESLVTLDDADAYFATRSNVNAWLQSDVNSKQLYLNDATRFIDQFVYLGRKTNPEQEHEWPRYGILMDNVLLDKDRIPANIKYAVFEIAFALSRGVDPERELNSARVVSRGLASVRTTYDPGRVPEHLLYGCASATAWLYLLPFLSKDGNGIVRLHRVN